MEKQNKAMRQKRKKEEVTRIRTLVGEWFIQLVLFSSMYCVPCADTAYSLDPRIKKFKEAEKAEKEARKRAKAEAAKQEADERERVRIVSLEGNVEGIILWLVL